VEVDNGVVQISSGGGLVGLLAERGPLCCGVLLTKAQAHELARLLVDEAREASDDPVHLGGAAPTRVSGHGR
jgi:hypothetical protein